MTEAIRILGEPKYSVLPSGQLVNRQSGKLIPEDEPVIVFRAQDARLPDVLAFYLANCNDPGHRLAISLRLAEVLEWQANNHLLVKEPDTVLDDNWPAVRHL